MFALLTDTRQDVQTVLRDHQCNVPETPQIVLQASAGT